MFSWKILKWVFVPMFVLLLLAVATYFIISESIEGPEVINKQYTSVSPLLDFGGKSRDFIEWDESTRIEGIGDEISATEPQNNIDDQSINSNETDLMYSDSDMTFIDRLLSSFKETFQKESDSQEIGMGNKQLKGISQSGYNVKIPNGHKYGDYQGVPSMTKYLGYSTTPLPVSPTLPSMPVKTDVTSTTQASSHNVSENSSCYSPRLAMCRGVLPWDLTTLPNVPGVTSPAALTEALPYFELITQSGCSTRARQFLCSILEPQCQPMGTPILPPCKKACKAVAEECNDFILDILDLSQVFRCENYPDTDNQAECVNLARGDQCQSNELRCEDGTCIPNRWKCDGVKDCAKGTDEENCTYCRTHQFRCKSGNKCVPLTWRCDGRPDCEDNSDEFGCDQTDYGRMTHSHASPCPSGELRCVDGRCITLQQICDGSRDCSDGADEASCRSPFT